MEIIWTKARENGREHRVAEIDGHFYPYVWNAQQNQVSNFGSPNANGMWVSNGHTESGIKYVSKAMTRENAIYAANRHFAMNEASHPIAADGMAADMVRTPEQEAMLKRLSELR